MLAAAAAAHKPLAVRHILEEPLQAVVVLAALEQTAPVLTEPPERQTQAVVVAVLAAQAAQAVQAALVLLYFPTLKIPQTS